MRGCSLAKVAGAFLLLGLCCLRPPEARAQVPSTTAEGKCRFPLATWITNSEAMLPNIVPGDVMASVCLAHAVADSRSAPDSLDLAAGDYALQPGDLLVTKWPGHPEHSFVVKRLIGVAGDRIRFTNSIIYLNGVAVPRTREPDWTGTARKQQVTLPRWKETLPDGKSYDVVFQVLTDTSVIENTQEFLVPPGNIFVVGDNRDDSADGRLPAFGFVPYGDVIAVIMNDNPDVEAIVERVAPSILKQVAPWWRGPNRTSPRVKAG